MEALQLPQVGAANDTGRIITDLSDDEYHSERYLGLVSNSGLKVLKRSPAHYKAWIEGKASKTSKAMEFGKAFHMAALEPEKYVLRYAVRPDFGDLRTKAAKELRDAWLEEHTGCIEIASEDHEAIVGMCSSIRLHPAASRLLSGGQREVTLKWTDQETGLRCKARADLWREDMELVGDLKSTEDASPEAFAKSVYNFGYHQQDALYRDGFLACGNPIQHFALVACEKVEPYAVAVYALDADAVSRGSTAARSGIDRLAECVRTNTWNAYSTGVEELSLPRWAQ